MTSNVEKDVEELKSEFSELKSDMAKLAETLKKLYGDSADHGRERVKAAAERSGEQAREAAGALEAEIGERPLASVAIAFGIGFVLGKLFDR